MNTTTEHIDDKRLKDFYQDTLTAFGAYFPTEEENVGERIADYCGVRFYIDRLRESDNRMDEIPVEEEATGSLSYLETKPFEFVHLLTKLYDSYHYEGKDWKNLESLHEGIKDHLFQKFYFKKYEYDTLRRKAENQLSVTDILQYRIITLLREVDDLWNFYPKQEECSNMKYQHPNLTYEFASLPDQKSYCARFLGTTKEDKPSIHQFHTIYSSNLGEELYFLNLLCNYPSLDNNRITLEYNYSDGGNISLSFSQLDGDHSNILSYDLKNENIKISQAFRNQEKSISHKATLEEKLAVCQMLEKFIKEKDKIESKEEERALKK